jgi:hypothetical protein
VHADGSTAHDRLCSGPLHAEEAEEEGEGDGDDGWGGRERGRLHRDLQPLHDAKDHEEIENYVLYWVGITHGNCRWGVPKRG